MEELIKVTESKEGRNQVSARDLHEFLGIKSKIGDWMDRRIKKYGFIETIDFIKVSQIQDTLGGPQEVYDYVLTIDTAKELAMVEGNDKGKIARQYFIACENKLKDLVKPKTPAEILLEQAQMLVDHERKLSQIEEKVNYLIEDKENARQQLISLPLSGDDIPEETLRSKVVRLVNLYSRYTGLYQQDIWNKMYEQMIYRYHINIKARKKIKGEKNNLDVAERLMCLDKLHALISKMVTDANVVVDYNY